MKKINQKEKFFDELSLRWHQDNILTHRERRLFKSIIPDSELSRGGIFLDLGGGTGRLSEYLSISYSMSYLVLDFSHGMLKAGIEHCPHPSVSRVQSDAHRLPLQDESVQFICSFCSFPHFERKEEVLRECRRVLVGGGSFVILHSCSREEINQFHSGHSPAISADYLPPLECFRQWGEKLQWVPIKMENDPDMFLVHFVKTVV
jgi:demethylmenaquinone methyltransferase/2-methoxy-6-polyprenyl-1,4-benzoquinol methylase